MIRAELILPFTFVALAAWSCVLLASAAPPNLREQISLNGTWDFTPANGPKTTIPVPDYWDAPPGVQDGSGRVRAGGRGPGGVQRQAREARIRGRQPDRRRVRQGTVRRRTRRRVDSVFLRHHRPRDAGRAIRLARRTTRARFRPRSTPRPPTASSLCLPAPIGSAASSGTITSRWPAIPAGHSTSRAAPCWS